jgi:hypothetical protein
MADPIIATLSCGCRLTFREGVEGSPVTVVLAVKAATCVTPIHVAGLPLFDRREALRPATRPVQTMQTDLDEG